MYLVSSVCEVTGYSEEEMYPIMVPIQPLKEFPSWFLEQYKRPPKTRISSWGKQNWELISSFCRDVHEICALLGYYVASSGNCLPTFRDNVSVNNYHTKPRNIPEERRSKLRITRGKNITTAKVFFYLNDMFNKLKITNSMGRFVCSWFI
jgi:hypothetical protein